LLALSAVHGQTADAARTDKTFFTRRDAELSAVAVGASAAVRSAGHDRACRRTINITSSPSRASPSLPIGRIPPFILPLPSRAPPRSRVKCGKRDPGAVKFVVPILYTAALIPPLSRIYRDQHWASDIVAGAFLGTLLGNKVVSYAHSHRRNKLDKWLLGTAVVPNGRSGWLVMKSIER
jgi:hypothetical protein